LPERLLRLFQLLTLVIVGKHADTIGPLLTEKQARTEAVRPERLPLGEFAYLDSYGSPVHPSEAGSPQPAASS